MEIRVTWIEERENEAVLTSSQVREMVERHNGTCHPDNRVTWVDDHTGVAGLIEALEWMDPCDIVEEIWMDHSANGLKVGHRDICQIHAEPYPDGGGT